MINVPVYDSSGNPLENTSLPEERFGGKVHRELLRDVVIMHEANHRRGTASTKTRGKVKEIGRASCRERV